MTFSNILKRKNRLVVQYASIDIVESESHARDKLGAIQSALK